MADDVFKRMEKAGKLKKVKAGIVQTELLLKEAIIDLKEAKKVSHIAERATYLLAYNAMLKAGRALILLKGYTPDDGAQHRTVVEITGAILGEKYKKLINKFENMRRKRNEMTYEAGVLLSKSEAESSFLDAISLVKEVLAEVKEKNPQIEIVFNLNGK